jgi:nucleotide-binding universal stress UspA family protein
MPTLLHTEKRIALKNILFATDFSQIASNAMRYAGALARDFGANLHALYVQEPINYAVPPEMWQSAQHVYEDEITALRNNLVQEFPDVPSEVLTADGRVWPAMALACERYCIDLVVLGTHGRTGLGKMLLGSQAEEILRHATCPALTIGPNVEMQDAPTAKFYSILFATDFGPASEGALALALSFAEEHKADLTLLHVIEPGKAIEFAHPERLVSGIEQRLRDLVPEEAGLWCTPRYVVEQGVPAEKILEAAKHNHADLIVLGVHRTGGVPGALTHLPVATVHKVVAHATCPVLTVRA